MTLFGNSVSADIIKLKWGHTGSKFNDWYPYKERGI